jgi:hypothetical protein
VHLQEIHDLVRSLPAFAINNGCTLYFAYNINKLSKFRINFENAVGEIFSFEGLPEDEPPHPLPLSIGDVEGGSFPLY